MEIEEEDNYSTDSSEARDRGKFYVLKTFIKSNMLLNVKIKMQKTQLLRWLRRKICHQFQNILMNK